MKIDNNKLLMGAFLLLNVGLVGCQPRTPAEKAQDKIEDAQHETGQAIERAGDRVKDSAHH
jgi:hypothetical protein